jgi:dipeptidase D
MNTVLSGLKPASVWKNFEALCAFPHPSGHEAAIREYVFNFAKQLGLETIVDEVGNLIIRKPATKGMENRKGVILQAHLDMVPQKNNDTAHNFETDPIRPQIDGEWVKAHGTTLGADNGIGVAAAMSVLESKDIKHGPVEVLLTIDEETGMTGAFGLKGGILKGDILLNMDSEDEGELYVGCAGGTNAGITFTFTPENVPAGYSAYTLYIKGLKGGHSGVDISLGRGNSNKVLFRFLKQAQNAFGIRIATIDGGSLRNAIPRESSAVIVLPSAHAQAFLQLLATFENIIKNELSSTEPDLKAEAIPANMPEKVMDVATQQKLIHAVNACPNGVVRMSADMHDLVETSNNLAIINLEGNEVKILCLLRSSVDSAKLDLESVTESVFTLAGAETVFDGQYPGWKPNMQSPVLKAMSDIYKNKYGKIPEIRAIHAGLECGLLGGVYPNWDMISFGPTIRFPHSPDEKVNIKTVEMFWDFLVETLKNIPVK